MTSTTRPPRLGEENGKAYNFFSREEFERRITLGEFIEHMGVHGFLYGTRHEDLAAARKGYRLVISLMDPFGALAMLRKYPDARTIFVDAPREELRRRLIARGDSKEAVTVRMKTRRKEIRLKNEFGLYVQNIDLSETLAKIVGNINKWHAGSTE